MYPAHVLALFPPFPRGNRVFVLMPFAEAFNARWRTVIEPAIRTDAGLDPHRVDIPRTAGSIPTEIVTGIAEARLVFADVSVVERWTRNDGSPGWMRNGNVMYEVGIAHAVRQAEEVILFRSDDEPLLFDVASLRVNRYDPDRNVVDARRLVSEAVQPALREIDVSRGLSVRRAMESLTGSDLSCLFEASSPAGLPPQHLRTMGQVLGGASRAASIARLLEMGLIATAWGQLKAVKDMDVPWEAALQEMGVRYRATEFGRAVVTRIGQEWNVALSGERGSA